ncbi:MAG: hypothetical protein JXR76_01015 [Deltaproteobacteria bacterium]|nr:hypothetical protein [Deltaproteobacteria bacterium]
MKENTTTNKPSPATGQAGKAAQAGPAAPIQLDKIKNMQTARKFNKIQKELSSAPTDYEAKSRKRRKKRAIRLVQKLMFFVVIPTIVASVYFYRYANDQYESIASVSIQRDGAPSVGLDTIIGSFGGSGSAQDALTIEAYILSRDMLRSLDKEENYIQHFKNPKIDIITRLKTDATFEDAYEFYQKMILVEYSSESGVLGLKVRAFDAQSAQRFARRIIELSEVKVNKLSSKMQEDKINFTTKVLKESKEKLAVAQKGVLDYQKEVGDFAPESTAGSLMHLKNQLEGNLAMAQTQLSEARSIMTADAPKVVRLTQKIQSLKAQIRKENEKLIGDEEGGMGQKIVEFEMAALDKKLAEREYQSALVSLEAARLDAMKQSRYLVEISSPNLPDEATYPIRWLKVLTVFLVSIAIFGVLSLTVSAIKEHARI